MAIGAISQAFLQAYDIIIIHEELKVEIQVFESLGSSDINIRPFGNSVPALGIAEGYRKI